jgi:ABC-type nitrate/sulfonate/bicarbonate transport system substrate-binding protein
MTIGRSIRAFFAVCFVAFIFPTPSLWAQAKVRVNWTATSGAMSGVWIAYEEGIFKKNGLEVQLIHIPSASRAIQVMLAGEIAFSTLDVLNTVQADLGGANIAMVAAVTNRLVFSLMARPDLKRVIDLKGRKVGITRVGSSTHTATLYALNQAGVKLAEAQILPLMEVPNILAALVAGKVDAGTVSPPTNSRARKAGFMELVNLAKEGPEYASVAIGTTRSFITANEETTRRLVRSYVEAVHLFNTNKAAGVKAIQKYARVTDADILEDTYTQFRDYLEPIPYVSKKGLGMILAEMSEKDPKARQAKAEDFTDMRFVAELEKEGLFKKLWGK